MKKEETLHIAINNLSRELSGILYHHDYHVGIIPNTKMKIDRRYFKKILNDMEFHMKEYKILTGKEHKLNNKLFEFYEGMWYLKNKGII